jgi:hypothetical protein
MDYSEQEIKHIVELYKKKRAREKKRYDRIKDTDAFKQENRRRSKEHYYKHKDIKVKYYSENKDYINAKSSFTYYKNNKTIEEFKEKYPDRYKLLVKKNYAMLQSPSESTDTPYSSSSSAEPSDSL